MRLLVLLGLTLAVACGDDIPDIGAQGSLGSADGASTAGSAGSADAASSTTVASPAEVVLEGRLKLEVISSADVVVTRSENAASATVWLFEGFGVAPDGETMEGSARIDPYPEINATVFTARLSVDPIADGPCGAEPISLALSLHADDESGYVAGGLTPYCGADTWHGVPAIEPLRLSGRPSAE